MGNTKEQERMLCEGWKLTYKQYKNNRLVNLQKFAELEVLASAANVDALKIYNKERLAHVAEGALGFAILGGLATFVVPGMWILGAICGGVAIVSGVMCIDKIYNKWVTLKANTVWKWFNPNKFCDFHKQKLYHDTFVNLLEISKVLDNMYPDTESVAELDHYMDFRYRTINQSVSDILKNIENLENFSRTLKGRKVAGLFDFVKDYKTVLDEFAMYEQQIFKEYNNSKNHYLKLFNDVEDPDRELNEFLQSAWDLRHTVKMHDDIDKFRGK